ncbi:hypothetical protein GS438_15855, partial [Rhodococcus hoagii]|nr:hypothetical protein [Prescottella equi]
RLLGIPFAADPSQQLARLSGDDAKKLIQGATYLFTNVRVGSAAAEDRLSEEEIRSQVGLRVTTLGAKGVEIVDADGNWVRVGVVPERGKVDPTGVGDAFRAGFLLAHSAGLSIERSAQLGSLVAVYVLETVGTQEWTFQRDDALKRLTRRTAATPPTTSRRCSRKAATPPVRLFGSTSYRKGARARSAYRLPGTPAPESAARCASRRRFRATP